MNFYNYYLNGLYKNNLNQNFMYGGADGAQSDAIFQEKILPFFKNLKGPVELKSYNYIPRQYQEYKASIVQPDYRYPDKTILFRQNALVENLFPERWNDIDDIAHHKKYKCEEIRSQIVDKNDNFLYGYKNVKDNCPNLRTVRLNESQSEQLRNILNIPDSTLKPVSRASTMSASLMAEQKTNYLMNKLFLKSELNEATSKDKNITIQVSKIKYTAVPPKTSQYDDFKNFRINFMNNIVSTNLNLLQSFNKHEHYHFSGINTNLSIPNIYNKEINKLEELNFKDRNKNGAADYFKRFDNFRGLVFLFRYRAPDEIYFKDFQFNYLDKGRNSFKGDQQSIFIEQFLSKNNKEQLQRSEMIEVKKIADDAIESFNFWTGGMSSIYMIFIDLQDLYNYFSLDNGSPFSNVKDQNILNSNRDTVITNIKKLLLPLLNEHIFSNLTLINDNGLRVI